MSWLPLGRLKPGAVVEGCTESSSALRRQIQTFQNRQDSDQQSLLESYYDVLFEGQLAAWWTDETAWPQKRDLKMFLDWFEVEFHSLVFDLCDEPIRVVENGEDTP